MDLTFGPAEERFRDEIRTWLHEHLVGDFTRVRGRGGLGDMDAFVDERIAWEKELEAAAPVAASHFPPLRALER